MAAKKKAAKSLSKKGAAKKKQKPAAKKAKTAKRAKKSAPAFGAAPTPIGTPQPNLEASASEQ